MNAGQMLDDVSRAVNGEAHIEFYGRLGGVVPFPDEILEEIDRVAFSPSTYSHGDPRKNWLKRLEKVVLRSNCMATETPTNLVYKRPEFLAKTPTHYCPGCTHGVAHRLIAEVMDEMDLREKTIGVASVGCSVFAYNYFDCDFVEAAHGRAPAMATGSNARSRIG